MENNDMMSGPTGQRVPEGMGIGGISVGMGGGILINNKSEIRKSKKKAGLLRGLGSMFRFGKHRKSGPPSPELEPDTIITSATSNGGGIHERRPSGPAGLTSSCTGRPDVDRHHVLRRTLPPDDRDRAELGRQMALAAARQVIVVIRLNYQQICGLVTTFHFLQPTNEVNVHFFMETVEKFMRDFN